ncbi:MAG: DUF1015 domain-containing protein [Flavobacteriales bacterium]|nr:DUF1015 domain-containing protein [Flavobacteriales bacterium]
MIHVRPFRAWRPAPHTAHLVGSRSFLNYSTEQLREKLAGNPYTFLHIVYADHDRHGLTRAEHFDGVRRKFTEFTEKHILQREEHPAFYLYEQSCGAFTSRGIIGAVAVTDYREGRVKVHEQTLATREELFSDYLDHTGINAEPVLLAVPDAPDLEAALDDIAQRPTLYDFCTTDQVRHRFWKVDAPRSLSLWAGTSSGCPRCTSPTATTAVPAAHGWRTAFTPTLKAPSLRSWPSWCRSASCTSTMRPHRERTQRTFRRSLSDRTAQGGHIDPAIGRPGRTGSAKRPGPCKSGWYALALPKTSGNNPVDALDAAVLSEAVLGPVLGISDLRTDPRIRFVPGTHDTSELEQAISSGKADVAFHLRAVTFNEMRTVADSGRCMPPKTTWIEPKLRSGLTIYSLEDH